MAFFSDIAEKFKLIPELVGTTARAIQSKATAQQVEKKRVQAQETTRPQITGTGFFSDISEKYGLKPFTPETPFIKRSEELRTGIRKEFTPYAEKAESAVRGGQDLALNVIGLPEKIVGGKIAGTLTPRPEDENIYQYLSRQPFLTEEPVQEKLKERGIDPKIAMGIGIAGSLAIPAPGGAEKKGLKIGKELADNPLLSEARKYKSAEEFVNSPRYEYHLSSEANLAEGKTFAEQATKATSRNRGFANAAEEGIYSTNSPQFWATQLESDLGKKAPQNVYLVEVKNPSPRGMLESGFDAQAMNAAQDVRVIKKLGTTKDLQDMGRIESLKKSQLTSIWNEANKGKGVEAYGAVAGFETDDEGNISFNQDKALLGMVGVAGIVKGKQKLLDEAIKNGEKKFLKDQKLIQTGNKAFIISEKPSFWTDIKKALSPFKYAGENVKQIWKRRVADFSVANEKANVEFQKLEDLPGGLTGMLKYQTGQMGKDWRYAERVKKVFDDLYNEAELRGIDVGYRENYLPQVYSNTPDEIRGMLIKYMKDKGVDDKLISEYLAGNPLPREVSATLKLNPTFSKERAFPNYGTAMQYGLTPKYQHPAQLAAHYRNELERTVANRRFIESMKEEGELIGMKLPGYKPVDIPYSMEELYAKPKTAKALNEYFRDEDNLGLGARIAKAGAELSSKMQSLVLSGGVPSTNINFFTAGQGIRSLQAGEVKVLGNLARSNFDTATMGYFRTHQPYINKMAEEGIDLSRRVGNWDKAYDTISSKTGFARGLEIAGEKFEDLFNKKTFQSFMPMQSVSVFKRTYDKAILNGLSELEARKLAGDTTKAWGGIIEDWGRGKTFQDTINTIFFAPRFRESLINLFSNTIRSVSTDIKNPAFKMNRRFVVGSAIAYAAYNALNKKMNGNFMWENERGKEFDLKIPIEGDRFLYLAFLPSVMAFPRNMISGGLALAEGDLELAGQKFGSLFSMPLKLQSEVISNRDYFGREIYDPEGSRTQKIKEIAKYVGLSYNHPYALGLYNLIAPEKEKKDWLEVLLRMAEAPLKFNTLSKIQKGQFYDALDKQKAERQKAKDEVQKIYDNLQKMKAEGRGAEADEIFNGLSQTDKELYKSIKTAEKTRATNEMKMRLYPLYERLQKLKAEGQEDYANEIYSSLTPEEKRVYKLIKNTFKDYE